MIRSDGAPGDHQTVAVLRPRAEGQAEDLIMVPLSGGPLLGVERV